MVMMMTVMTHNHGVVIKLSDKAVTAIREGLKPGFHYPSWRPELTARVDGWPVSITRQHGPCWRARVSTSRVDGPSTRPVNSNSGNRAGLSNMARYTWLDTHPCGATLVEVEIKRTDQLKVTVTTRRRTRTTLYTSNRQLPPRANISVLVYCYAPDLGALGNEARRLPVCPSIRPSVCLSPASRRCCCTRTARSSRNARWKWKRLQLNK